MFLTTNRTQFISYIEPTEWEPSIEIWTILSLKTIVAKRDCRIIRFYCKLWQSDNYSVNFRNTSLKVTCFQVKIGPWDLSSLANISVALITLLLHNIICIKIHICLKFESKVDIDINDKQYSCQVKPRLNWHENPGAYTWYLDTSMCKILNF